MAARKKVANTREIVRTLLAHKAEVNPKGPSATEKPIYCAAELGDTAILQLLLDHKAPLENDNRLVSIAAQHGHTQAIDLLISHGAPFDAQTSNTTPLKYALKNGHPETAEQLISYEFTHLKPHHECEKIACIASVAWQLPYEVVEIIAHYKGLEEDKPISSFLGSVFYSISRHLFSPEPSTTDFLPPHRKLDIYNKSISKLRELYYPPASLPLIMRLRETPFDQQPFIKLLVQQAFESLRAQQIPAHDLSPAAAQPEVNQRPQSEPPEATLEFELIKTMLLIS